MLEINVNAEDLRSAATKFVTASTRCTAMKDEIKATTNSMMDVWRGNAKDAFEHEFLIIYKNMNTHSEILKDISDELLATVSSFEVKDVDLSKGILFNNK